MGAEIVLEFKKIVKHFPGVLALDGVSLSFKKGEIHALIGENGAGKSTLIKTCTGAYVPTSGTIVINGKEFSRLTPISSSENGIAVIYQEFNLINELSVAENVFLGNPIKKGMFIDIRAMEAKTKVIFNDFGIDINPRRLVKSMSIGYQQMVEIAKAVSRETKILIMDEPSAALTSSEVEMMFRIIHKLRDAGVTIVYISHRLDEVFKNSDRVTVLRDGKLIKTLDTKNTCRNELISLMVGRDLKETFPKLKNTARNEYIIEVSHLSGNGLKDVSFKLKRGELLGFGGLIGSGRTETAQILFGAAKMEGGEIKYKGKNIAFRNPSEAIKMGIALVPEDRKAQGLLLHLPVAENITMPSMKKISMATVINKREERVIVDEYKNALRIKTPSNMQLVKNLSGGNQQKVVLAKWLATKPDVIIFDEPTRGIDVGAKQEIYNIMQELLDMGKTIIMISSDMEELLGMSSRIIVFCEGRVTGELQREEFSQMAVLNLASRTTKE